MLVSTHLCFGHKGLPDIFRATFNIGAFSEKGVGLLFFSLFCLYVPSRANKITQTLCPFVRARWGGGRFTWTESGSPLLLRNTQKRRSEKEGWKDGKTEQIDKEKKTFVFIWLAK